MVENHPDRRGDSVNRAISELKASYKLALEEAKKGDFCRRCGGKGKFYLTIGFHTHLTTCHPCRGTGKIIIQFAEGNNHGKEN